MRRRHLLGLFAAITACTQSPAPDELNPATKAAVRDSVLAAAGRYDRALTSLDSAQIAGFFAPIPEFELVVGRMRLGRSSVLQWAGGLRATHRSVSGGLALDSVNVVVLSPRAALVIASITNVWTDTAGVVATDRGTGSTTWALVGHDWRIVAAHLVWDAPELQRP